MKITVLCENGTVSPSLSCEHGLSLHIKRAGGDLLFDMGQSGMFADNAKALGIDLTKVTAAFLSHGHYDHGGGLERFFEENAAAPVYMGVGAFGAHYSGTERYIGLNSALCRERMIFCKEDCTPLDGLRFFALKSKTLPETFDARMLIKSENKFFTDQFDHERYLLLEEEGKKILISGCSHRGILNILKECQPDVFIGGFHFMKVDVQTRQGRSLLEHAAQEMLRTGARFFTGHCTGEEQFVFLKERMGDRLSALHTGTVITL